MSNREPAWRIFAGEFNASTIEHSTGEEYAPVYVVTPLGAFVNRLFVAGVLTEKSNVGSPDEPLWRARVSDPSGVFYISAGQYQPEAAQVLNGLEPPVYIAVSGKSRTYSPEAGLLYVSLRPEMIRTIDQSFYYYWVLETCARTKERIDAFAEIAQMADPKLEECEALGISQRIAKGMIFARENYGNPDLERYTMMVRDAFDLVRRPAPEPSAGGMGIGAEPVGVATGPPMRTSGPDTLFDEGFPPSGFTTADQSGSGRSPGQTASGGYIDQFPAQNGGTGSDAAPDPAAIAAGDPEALEEVVLGIVEELDTSAKGANWQAISDKAAGSKIDHDMLEEILRSLQEKGAIYEPTLGYIKLVPP